jgi:diguanylate cyclase (GGDEF)-like protein
MPEDLMLLFWKMLAEDDGLVERLRKVGLFAMDYRSGWSRRSAVMEQLGHDPLRMGAEAFEALIHAKDRERCASLWLMARRGDADEFSATYRIMSARGEWHWIKSRWAVLRRTPEGDIALLVGVDEEITADKEIEEDLRSQIVEADQRFGLAEALRAAGLAATASLDISATISNVLQQAQLCVPFNEAAVYSCSANELNLIGVYPREKAAADRPVHGSSSPIWEVVSTKCPRLVDRTASDALFSQPELFEDYRSWIGIPLIHRRALLGVLELWNAEAGEFRSDHLWPAMAFGDILAVELSAEGKYRDLVIEASTDPLTGLLSRRGFDRLGSELLARLAEKGQPIALILADIDHFKSFNDRFGHLKGDEVLREVAKVLKKGVRQEDILCRFGGEEMVALLPNTTEAVAMDVAERLRSNLERRTFAGIDESVTASFGVATSCSSSRGSLDDLIGEADRAMYRAKKEGRNRVVLSE